MSFVEEQVNETKVSEAGSADHVSATARPKRGTVAGFDQIDREQFPFAYVNRIVEYIPDYPLDQLLFHPENWRIHPQFQQEVVDDSHIELGILQPLLLNKTTEHIINGHLRTTLASRRDLKSYPVLILELEEHEEYKALGILDSSTSLAVTDPQMLAQVMSRFATARPSLQKMFEDMAAGVHANFKPPSLDQLTEKFGEPDPAAFWNQIKIKVPPETYQKYLKLMEQADGETDDEKFANLLGLAEDGL